MTKPDIFHADAEDLDGKNASKSKRAWVQTELIKAHIAQAQRGIDGAYEMALIAAGAFKAVYLRANGSWNDQINDKGDVISKTIPTCLLYTSPSPRDKRQSRMPSSA